MTKEAALYDFFSSFDIPAYVTTSVPEDAKYPYITYENIVDSWSGDQVGITVNIWYYTDSEAQINAKARQVASGIGLGGRLIECDGGVIWLKRGTPWCQSVPNENNTAIKRRYINVTAQYFTMD